MLAWSEIASALERHGRTVLATVVSVRGSAPREAGARIVVRPDQSFSGTIGGGTLEYQAIATAASLLAGDIGVRAQMRSFALGPQLGQCCGGHVDLLFEVFSADQRAQVDDLAHREREGPFTTRGVITDAGVVRDVRPATMSDEPTAVAFVGGILTETFGDHRRGLYLFGAGHVGRATMLALAPLPFLVTWLDVRAHAFPQRFPSHVVTQVMADPTEAIASAEPGSIALDMTHRHQIDQAVVQALLSDDRFAYVGLIGSTTKRARFSKRLAAAGIADARIADLVCPIGIAGIRSKAPAAIAAATVAELLVRDEAVRAAHAAPASVAVGTAS